MKLMLSILFKQLMKLEYTQKENPTHFTTWGSQNKLLLFQIKT